MPGDEILSPEEVAEREKLPLTFVDLDRTVEACVGESVLQAALRHGIHIEHACGGFCACSTCHVIVEEGMAALSDKQDDEEDRLDTAVGLTLRSRLSCQCELRGGPVKLRIGPHR
ncbi:MAG: 2Fe-2S iron-sulfur cluster-binding protein [Planctomycetes bacterium]|jgi:2Fe-2S ferredoxin|nr:2Fe-2S iron-sulfur cluster-binding protein [Planctomycetota bacterium]